MIEPLDVVRVVTLRRTRSNVSFPFRRHALRRRRRAPYPGLVADPLQQPSVLRRVRLG